MDTIEVIIWLIKKSNITSRSSVRYLPGTSQYPVRSLWSIPLFYWLPWLVRRINVFRVERGFNVCSPSFYMFLKTTLRIMRKNSTWHISNAIWGNQITQCPASCLVPSMPSVSQKGNSVWPYDLTVAPVFPFQALSTGEAEIYLCFHLLACGSPIAEMLHAWMATGGVDMCSAHASFCCGVPPRCTVPLQINNLNELEKVCLQQAWNYGHVSPCWLNACFLFMAPSTLINIRNSLIMYFTYLMYLCITHIFTL